MNILEWLRERRGLALYRRKQMKRDQLADLLYKMRQTDNKGLLLKLLIGHPEVDRYHLVTGMYSYCDVTMSDGFTISGHGTWSRDIIRDAILQVVDRMKEKHEL